MADIVRPVVAVDVAPVSLDADMLAVGGEADMHRGIGLGGRLIVVEEEVADGAVVGAALRLAETGVDDEPGPLGEMAPAQGDNPLFAAHAVERLDRDGAKIGKHQ